MPIQGLESQLVAVTFDKGMETRESRKLTIPGQWTNVENASLSGTGSLEKREGLKSYITTSTTQLTGANGLATHRDELLITKGPVIYSAYDASQPVATVLERGGGLANMGVTKEEVDNVVGYQYGCDCAATSRWKVYVWRAGAGSDFGTQGIRMTAVDAVTGVKLLDGFNVVTDTGAGAPRIVARDLGSGNFAFFIVWYSATISALRCRVYRPGTSTTTVGAAVSVVAGATLRSRFDVANAFNAVVIAYQWADTVTSVRVVGIDQTAGVPSVFYGPFNVVTEPNLLNARLTGITVHVGGGGSSDAAAPIGVFTATNTIAGFYTGVTAFMFTPFLVADVIGIVSGTTSPGATIGVMSSPLNVSNYYYTILIDSYGAAGTDAVVLLQRFDASYIVASSFNTFGSITISNSNCFSGATATGAGAQGPFILGRPFGPGLGLTSSELDSPGRIWIPVYIFENSRVSAVRTLNQQNSVYIMDAFDGTIVGHALYGGLGVGFEPITGAGATILGFSSTPAFGDGYVMCVPASQQVRLQGDPLGSSLITNATRSGVVALTWTPRTVAPPIKTNLGEATYLAAGALTAYDGSAGHPHGLLLFPTGISAVVGGVGTGNMDDGTYQLVAIYEWVDAAGARTQSAPSLPISVTVNTGGANSGSITVNVPTLQLGTTGVKNRAGVALVVYATQLNGTTLTRVISLANTTATTTVAATIQNKATTWAPNELLYTQPNQSGSTLANDRPGPASCLCVHQGRVFLDLTDQPSTFRYSQPYTNGLGLQFNGTLGGTVPTEAGAIVAFAAMDEKVFVFCERKIYVVLGSGPASSGAYNNYSDPVEVPGDVGCLEPQSVVKFPDGLIFKSTKGFMLLTRDLSVRYIGSGVSDYDVLTVTSAVMLESKDEIRFTTRATGTSPTNGRHLVYSYRVNAWSVFTYQDFPTLQDSIWWPAKQRWTVLGAPVVLFEEPGQYVDQESPSRDIVMSARLAFLHLAQLEGFQRAKWLYVTGSSSLNATPTSTFQVNIDYDDVYSAFSTAAPTGAYQITVILSTITTFRGGSGALGPSSSNGWVMDLRHKLRRQKCKSIAFTFVDTGSGGLTSIEALALVVGLKRGTNKLPSTQTVP